MLNSDYAYLSVSFTHRAAAFGPRAATSLASFRDHAGVQRVTPRQRLAGDAAVQHVIWRLQLGLPP